MYLSWQVANLRFQIADARRASETLRPWTRVSWQQLGQGLRPAIHERNATTDATAWADLVVILWMVGCFATLLPLWANQVVRVFSR